MDEFTECLFEMAYETCVCLAIPGYLIGAR
jgi:hypothetical protein